MQSCNHAAMGHRQMRSLFLFLSFFLISIFIFIFSALTAIFSRLQSQEEERRGGGLLRG